MLRELSFNSDELKTKWQELYSDNPRLLPYSSRKYAELFKKYFSIRTRRFFLQKHFYGFYDEDDKLLMILPLTVKGRNIYIFGDFANEEILDFIYRESIESKHFELLFNELANKFKGYKLILNRLSPDSLLHEWLQEKGYQSMRLKSCAKLKLPSSYNEYLKKLSINTRYNVRKSERLIRELGKPYNLEFLQGPISRDIKNELFRIYDKREAEREGKKSTFWTCYKRKELNALTDACTQENNSFNVFLYVDGKMVVFASGLLDFREKRFIIRKTAIDSNYAKCSPGIFLHTQMIKWLIENTELEWLDLAGGHEIYKYNLGCEEYFCHSYEIEL